MFIKQYANAALLTATLATTSVATAGVTPDLTVPAGDLSADQIIDQVYFVNHFYALKNFAITKKGKKITVLISKSEGKKPTTNTLERYLNNDYLEDGSIRAKDLAIFRSGKLKGTGLLITDYDDDTKSQSYMIWLPALRKIRRFGQPQHNDAWGGTDFTFGDVVLRKPHNETHELLGKDTFKGCLGAMVLADNERNRYTKKTPDASCDHDGKAIYKVKSTTKFENWWYDSRVSYIDSATFADYRTEYFKDGKQVKVIDRDWKSLNMDDPRAQAWAYWYGKTAATNHETWAVIPDAVVVANGDYKKKKWTEKTLRKIKR